VKKVLFIIQEIQRNTLPVFREYTRERLFNKIAEEILEIADRLLTNCVVLISRLVQFEINFYETIVKKIHNETFKTDKIEHMDN